MNTAVPSDWPESTDAPDFVPVWGPGIGGIDDAPAAKPNHPPLDQIPPMPLPNDDGAFHDDRGWSGATAHDAETGATWNLPTFPESGLTGVQRADGFTGIGPVQQEEMTRTFADMIPAASLTAWPTRGNVKLVMHFIDTGGVDRWFVCSGTMADPQVVLCAAHCVYARTPNGFIINDWATEIYVYPAWDGVGNQFSAPNSRIENYGWSRGTTFLAGSDYINNGNVDRDCGLISLTNSRAVGSLTGWFSWAWGFDCATIQSRTYHNWSYPTENCPTGGLHTGRTMYYWFGIIDDCPNNQMELTTGGNCLDTLWGGMSGSGMYYIEGENRFVHGVASTSNRDDWGRYCKLWEQFTIDMVDFENDARGIAFDLEALMFRVGGSTTVTAGQSLAASTVQVVNPTNNNPPADDYVIRVYLSQNDNISAADPLLATWNFNAIDFAAAQNRTWNIPAPAIPIDTPSGSYFIGAELDPATDANAGNNDTDDWDADPVTVIGVADLVANSVSAPSGNFAEGETMSVAFDVNNQGGDPSNLITVSIRASLNTTISTADPELGSFAYGGLSGGGTLNTSEIVTIPASLLSGNYYIGIIADASDDVDGSNNTAFDAIQVGVVDRPVNDDCSSATTITTGLRAFDTTFATTDGAAHTECQYDGQTYNDVWYRLVAPCNGTLTATTCEELGGSADYDTDIVVYAGTSCSTLSLLGCNDDDPVNACGNGPIYHSTVQVPVTAGATYYVRVGGFGAFNAGTGNLLIDCDGPGLGDCCAPNGSPGCVDEPCQDAVCTADPYCCNVEWDQLCADAALVLCPAECGVTPCAADITGPSGISDGNVDALDFLMMIAQWGTPCTGTCEADITGPGGAPDGNVDSLDFLMMIAQWGSPGVCP